MSPSCRDFDRLSAAHREASPQERELWRRHLEGCERCAAAAVLAVWILATVDWSAAAPGAVAVIGVVLGVAAAVSPLLWLHRGSPLAPPGWG